MAVHIGKPSSEETTMIYPIEPIPIPQVDEDCPRCNGDGCYDCGGTGKVTPAEADFLAAEDALDFDDDF